MFSVELYHQNKGIYTFQTRVRSIDEKDGAVYVSLEESYFYPEGGGQPADKGTINGKEVLSVIRNEGIVLHEVMSYSGLTLNMPVSCVIDRETREDHSVQHTAQHLLSAVLQESFGITTLSFHLGKEDSTIDIDSLPEEETLREVEVKANGFIVENLPVTSFVRDRFQLQDIPLRKNTDLTHNVRIVQIGNLDYSACGGTHVDSLSKLLILRIVRCERYKDGARLHFLAGKRAYRNILENEDVLRRLKKELQCGYDELPFRVVSLLEEKEDLGRKVNELYGRLAEALSDGYDEDFIVDAVDYDGELLKLIGASLNKKGRIAVFYRESDLHVYAFTGDRAHAGKIFSDAKAGLLFHGGGGRSIAQGYLEKEEDLRLFISRVYESLLSLQV